MNWIKAFKTWFQSEFNTVSSFDLLSIALFSSLSPATRLLKLSLYDLVLTYSNKNANNLLDSAVVETGIIIDRFELNKSASRTRKTKYLFFIATVKKNETHLCNPLLNHLRHRSLNFEKYYYTDTNTGTSDGELKTRFNNHIRSFRQKKVFN